MPSALKSAAAAAFHRTGGLAAVRWMHRHEVRILMYHRFAGRAALVRQCAHLRRYYQPVSMNAVSDWLHAGKSLPECAVAVTVDDGYADFEMAAAVFAEYRIPVTVFLVTGFLDGNLWLWFDRVLYAFANARAAQVSIPWPDGGTLDFKLDSQASRAEAGRRVADRAVALTHADRTRLVDNLPELLKAEMPAGPPPESRPLTWDAVRVLASSGVDFGAHTRTHPILSGLTDPAALRDEIAGSKARIEAELNCRVKHFCYPNGKMADIGAAAVEMVRTAGLHTAVTAEHGLNGLDSNAYLLPRIGADPGQDEMYFERTVAGWS